MALLMNRIGNTTNDKRFHQLFRGTLFEIIRMKPESPNLVSVAESALWYEVVRLCEATEKLALDEKPQDEAGQRRWLREFLRSYGQTGVGDEGGEVTVEFLNSLWTELNEGLFPRATTRGRGRNRVDVPVLNGQGVVFAHPHWNENCPVEAPDSLIKREKMSQPEQSIFLAG